MYELSIPHFAQNQSVIHLLSLSLLYFVTWSYILLPGKEFLIDDDEGINKYSDKWDEKKKEKKDSYEHKLNDDKKIRLKNRQFNPHLSFPGSVIRWVRLHLGKKFIILGHDEKGHPVTGYIQDPTRHHLISFLVHFANVFLGYFFLAGIFNPTLAVYSIALFVVHPVACQAVAWISGIGYLLCLFGALSAFNVIIYCGEGIWQVQLATVLSFFSAYGLFSGAFNWLIFALLGFYWAALLTTLVLIVNGIKQGREIVQQRVGEFRRQNMGASTVFRPSKFFYICKTYYYYIKMVVFPKRLGLFHKKYYHHDENIERPDREFFVSFLTICVIGALTFIAPFPVQFAVFWFVVYLLVFCNFITAMQALADRYAFISTFGFCIIAAYFLHSYPLIYGAVLGIYLMRTWVHLPTFDNLINFYQSNVFNFPDSEVAHGNLGVTLMHKGETGSALDNFLKGAKINEDYDVNLFNLYSIYKQNGQLEMAEKFLDKCLKAKIVHFPKEWEKEKENLHQLKRVNKDLNHYVNKINKGMEAMQ